MNQDEISSRIWDASCSIDTIECKLSGVADLLEIVAERVSTEPESGALWLARDTIKTLSDALQDRTHELMICMRAVQELKLTVTKKKGSKK
jgi:hypothetical protein